MPGRSARQSATARFRPKSGSRSARAMTTSVGSSSTGEAGIGGAFQFSTLLTPPRRRKLVRLRPLLLGLAVTVALLAFAAGVAQPVSSRSLRGSEAGCTADATKALIRKVARNYSLG